VKEIRQTREKKNRTQQEIADALGVTTRTLRYWETGEVQVPVLKRPEILKILNKIRAKKH